MEKRKIDERSFVKWKILAF